MTDAALIVFIKNSLPGRVKEKLASTVGSDSAFRIYINLLQHTLECTKDQNCEKFIFYSDFIPENDEWLEHGFKPCLQHGIDTGERMLNASLYVFSRGFNQVVMAGGDGFELEKELIAESFEVLKDKNVVLGPSEDGGYYLLGMDNLYAFLFFNKSWGTPHLFNETLKELNSHQLSFSLLPVLKDVDFEDDLPLGVREEDPELTSEGFDPGMKRIG